MRPLWKHYKLKGYEVLKWFHGISLKIYPWNNFLSWTQYLYFLTLNHFFCILLSQLLCRLFPPNLCNLIKFQIPNAFPLLLLQRSGICHSPSNYREVKFKILKLWGEAANPYERAALPNKKRKTTATSNASKKTSPHSTSKTPSPASTRPPKASTTLPPSTNSSKIPLLCKKSNKRNHKSASKNTASPSNANTSSPKSRKSTSYTLKSPGFSSPKSSKSSTNAITEKDCSSTSKSPRF